MDATALDDLSSVFAPDARFVDPFNDVRGHEALGAVLLDMLEQVQDLRFEVFRTSVSGDWAHVRWRFEGRVKALGSDPWVVNGMSEVRFAPDGRVLEHIDHWNAADQFYDRIPVVGWMIRLIRRRVAVR
jgi:steroid delta-isomerase